MFLFVRHNVRNCLGLPSTLAWEGTQWAGTALNPGRGRLGASLAQVLSCVDSAGEKKHLVFPGCLEMRRLPKAVFSQTSRTSKPPGILLKRISIQ